MSHHARALFLHLDKALITWSRREGNKTGPDAFALGGRNQTGALSGHSFELEIMSRTEKNNLFFLLPYLSLSSAPPGLRYLRKWFRLIQHGDALTFSTCSDPFDGDIIKTAAAPVSGGGPCFPQSSRFSQFCDQRSCVHV